MYLIFVYSKRPEGGLEYSIFCPMVPDEQLDSIIGVAGLLTEQRDVEFTELVSRDDEGFRMSHATFHRAGDPGMWCSGEAWEAIDDARSLIGGERARRHDHRYDNDRFNTRV